MNGKWSVLKEYQNGEHPDQRLEQPPNTPEDRLKLLIDSVPALMHGALPNYMTRGERRDEEE
jgi:hypothetical protein